MNIQKAIDWQRAVGIKRSDMMVEDCEEVFKGEANETSLAVSKFIHKATFDGTPHNGEKTIYIDRTKERAEAVDGVMDTIFSGIGLLMSLGLDEKEISECWDEICRSNYTKFPITYDKNGRIDKGANFEEPKLNKIIKNI